MLDYPQNWTIYHQEILFKANLEILGYSLILYPHVIRMFEKNIFDENIQIRLKHMPFFSWNFSLRQLCLNFRS